MGAQEWMHAKERMAKVMARFDDLDADHDGKITRAEWIRKFGNDDGFDHYDVDHNGVIDADEFARGYLQAKKSNKSFARVPNRMVASCVESGLPKVRVGSPVKDKSVGWRGFVPRTDW